MAAAYVKIYVNKQDDDHLVRTFGGNERDVKHMVYLYATNSKAVFLKKHPYFTEICKDGYHPILVYVRKYPYKQIIINELNLPQYVMWLIGKNGHINDSVVKDWINNLT